jgi:hypothetical protein
MNLGETEEMKSDLTVTAGGVVKRIFPTTSSLLPEIVNQIRHSKKNKHKQMSDLDETWSDILPDIFRKVQEYSFQLKHLIKQNVVLYLRRRRCKWFVHQVPLIIFRFTDTCGDSSG